MDKLNQNELVELEIELEEIKFVKKKQLITLLFISITTFIFHFFLIYLNNTLKMESMIDSILDFFTSGYVLFGTTIVFFLLISHLIKLIFGDYFDIFQFNKSSRIVGMLNDKKEKIIGFSVYGEDFKYHHKVKKESIFDKLALITYPLFAIFLFIMLVSIITVYENIISFIPMNYSVNKLIDTDEFYNFYRTINDLDIDSLKKIKTLPKRNINNSEEIGENFLNLDIAINTLSYSDDFLNLNISKKSEALKSDNYIYYYDLAQKYSAIGKKIEIAWDTNDIKLYNESINELEMLYAQFD